MRYAKKTVLTISVLILLSPPLSHSAMNMSMPDGHNSPSLVDSDLAIRTEPSEIYSKLPLSFEANEGQTDPRVKFLCRGYGYALFLTSAEAVLVLQGSGKGAGKPSYSETTSSLAGKNAKPAVVRMQFLGANLSPRVRVEDQLPGKSNYLIGNDPSRWHTDIPHYAKVKYEGIYSGIDLLYYGDQHQLEYDFVVSPGADPNSIIIQFQGVDGMGIDARGDLVLHTSVGEIRQHKPLIYQEKDGARKAICGGYLLKKNNQVSFCVDGYDRTRPLVIDPVLSYSTYLGGSKDDSSSAIAVDTSGNAYVTGDTTSIDFPVQSAFQSLNSGIRDVFVAKFSADGNQLVYSTYFGGRNGDFGTDIAIDSNGCAYVTGITFSIDFVVVAGSFQLLLRGISDAFVIKLNPQGNYPIYSTLLGGSEGESGNGITVDSANNAYVTGSTESNDFPVKNAFQPAFRGGNTDAFVTKLNPQGNALVYSTYLGGSGGESAKDIDLDDASNAYVTGTTSSTNFPRNNAFQLTLKIPNDAFVTKLNPQGNALVYSTYLGGNQNDVGYGIAVGANGSAYVTGKTSSTNFSVKNAFQSNLGGPSDAFVTKFSVSGTQLLFSTYLGGNDDDYGTGIALDNTGSACVTGSTHSTDFPVKNAIQPSLGGSFDAFVTKFSVSGTQLIYSTYLGGTEIDSGTGIAVNCPDKTDIAVCKPTVPYILSLMSKSPVSVYVTGSSYSTDFPVKNAIQPSLGGALDAFAIKLVETSPPTNSANAMPTPTTEANQKPVKKAYDQLPLSFEPNRGQNDGQVKFLARGRDYGLFLTSTQVVIVLQKFLSPMKSRFSGKAGTVKPQKAETVALRMQIVGGSRSPGMQGMDQLSGNSNYFIGNDPSSWHTDIPHFAKVKYQAVYPGIDMIFYGNQRQMEYDLVVAPGANPGAVTLKFEGIEQITLNEEGDLILQTPGGSVIQHAPCIYQEVFGTRRKVRGHYAVNKKNLVSFQVAQYDTAIPLVIDPVLSFSTYLGGTQTDAGYGIAVDSEGNSYVTGLTYSSNFPTTTNPFQEWPGDNNYNAFVTKLNPQGSALVYSTYLGGYQLDEGCDICVDKAANVHVTGFTFSSNFPTTTNPIQEWPGDNNYNAFVTKLNPQGNTLVDSTYLGGHQEDRGLGIALDTAGNAYVTGLTYSSDFPITAKPIQEWPGDNNFNAYVIKLQYGISLPCIPLLLLHDLGPISKNRPKSRSSN